MEPTLIIIIIVITIDINTHIDIIFMATRKRTTRKRMRRRSPRSRAQEKTTQAVPEGGGEEIGQTASQPGSDNIASTLVRDARTSFEIKDPTDSKPWSSQG